MSVAMPNMRLPFAATNPPPTVMALDRAVFEGGYSDSTSELVDADVSDGNRGIEALHCMEMWRMLWTITCGHWRWSWGPNTRARPMHTSVSYDVSAFYRLRKVGQVRLPPAAAAAAAATVAPPRCAEVKLLGRVAVQQMCDAFGIVALPGLHLTSPIFWV